MKQPALIIFVLLMSLPSALPAAELTPEITKRAKARIESLLGNRRGTSAPIVSPANPFVPPPAAPATKEAAAPSGDIPLTKADNLTRLAAALSVSGYIQIQGVPHLIINRLTYRENDLIPVRETSGSVSFLLLKKITDREFTLELDGAELLQKHTVK